MDTSTKTAAARAFVRSLNILLKFARMYDFGHPRTAAQYETAWKELRTALGDNEPGLLLAASGDKLLLDGVALESAAAEKSFARLLSNAGIASIHFSPKITQASLARFVKAFPTGVSARPASLAEQLKTALDGDAGIHINEVCFVPADSAVARGQVATQIAAATLGLDSEQCNELFKDPQMLLQLIAAAEGSRGSSGGPGGAGPGGGGPGGSGTGGGYYVGEPGVGLEGGPGGSGDTANDRGSAPGTGGTGGGYGSELPPVGIGGFGEGQNLGGGSGSGSGALGSTSGFDSGSGLGVDSGSAGDVPNVSGGAPGTGGVTKAGGSGKFSALLARGAQDGQINPATSGNAAGSSGAGVGSGGGSANRGRNFFGGGAGPGGGGTAPPSRWATATSSLRSPMGGSSGSGAAVIDSGIPTFEEDEVRGVMRMLAQVAGSKDKDKLDSNAFQSRLSNLPRKARFTLSQALSALAAQAPTDKPDQPMLLKLAEHIAIRFALESYERGDIRVNAVQETLERMSQEVEGLRKVLGVHEEKMARAGLHVSSHSEILAQQFWNEVSPEKKEAVLLSSEAWCIPGQNIRAYLDTLQKNGKLETLQQILANYAAGIKSSDTQVRRLTAGGLAELASFYAASEEKLLVDTIRETGLQLSQETDSELQSLVSAAFVRLAQEAIQKRCFPAIQRAVELVGFVEEERPALGKNLRPRIAVENRLPEFIEDSVKAGRVPEELTAFLRRIPKPAAEHLANRFSRCGFREDCDLLLDMVNKLGPEGTEHLRELLEKAPATEALDVLGIMARLDLKTVEQILPQRLAEWKRSAHDRAVRQLSSSGAPERGQLLLGVFDSLDSLIRPLAVDEIGLSGEHSGDLRLVRLAEGDLPDDASEYLQLKAIEALGRLRTPGAELVLRRILEARQVWRWMYPSELRVVAAQAMSKIDPEYVKEFLPRSGLSASDLTLEPLDPDPNSSCMRQRRYVRLRLEAPVPGQTTNLKENAHVEIPEMNLAGGVAMSDQRMYPGALVSLRLNAGGKPVKAQAIVRDANTQARAFELVDMDLEERAKLRRLLIQIGSALTNASPENRSRNRSRTILPSTGS